MHNRSRKSSGNVAAFRAIKLALVTLVQFLVVIHIKEKMSILKQILGGFRQDDNSQNLRERVARGQSRAPEGAYRKDRLAIAT